MNPYTESVSRGAALLDRERPGWRACIDLAMLDISNGCFCILGQVFGHYDDGIWALWEVDSSDDDGFAEAWEETDDFQTAVAHGFSIVRHHEWRTLQEAWVAELGAGFAERQEESAKNPPLNGSYLPI